jgi:hypothetical protein
MSGFSSFFLYELCDTLVVFASRLWLFEVLRLVYLCTKVNPFLYKCVSKCYSESLILAEYQPSHFVNTSIAGMSISTDPCQTGTSNSNFSNNRNMLVLRVLDVLHYLGSDS